MAFSGQPAIYRCNYCTSEFATQPELDNHSYSCNSNAYQSMPETRLNQTYPHSAMNVYNNVQPNISQNQASYQMTANPTYAQNRYVNPYNTGYSNPYSSHQNLQQQGYNPLSNSNQVSQLGNSQYYQMQGSQNTQNWQQQQQPYNNNFLQQGLGMRNQFQPNLVQDLSSEIGVSGQNQFSQGMQPQIDPRMSNLHQSNPLQRNQASFGQVQFNYSAQRENFQTQNQDGSNIQEMHSQISRVHAREVQSQNIPVRAEYSGIESRQLGAISNCSDPDILSRSIGPNRPNTSVENNQLFPNFDTSQGTNNRSNAIPQIKKSYSEDYAPAGTVKVMLIWRKQIPTKSKEITYFDTNGDIELTWNHQHNFYSKLAHLTPGEHEGTLSFPDFETMPTTLKFIVAEESDELQEIMLKVNPGTLGGLELINDPNTQRIPPSTVVRNAFILNDQQLNSQRKFASARVNLATATSAINNTISTNETYENIMDESCRSSNLLQKAEYKIQIDEKNNVIDRLHHELQSSKQEKEQKDLELTLKDDLINQLREENQTLKIISSTHNANSNNRDNNNAGINSSIVGRTSSQQAALGLEYQPMQVVENEKSDELESNEVAHLKTELNSVKLRNNFHLDQNSKLEKEIETLKKQLEQMPKINQVNTVTLVQKEGQLETSQLSNVQKTDLFFHIKRLILQFGSKTINPDSLNLEDGKSLLFHVNILGELQTNLLKDYEKLKVHTNKHVPDRLGSRQNSDTERMYHLETIKEKDKQIENLESEKNHLVAKNIHSTEEATSFKELYEEKEKVYIELRNKIDIDSLSTLENNNNERMYHLETIRERDRQIENLESEKNHLVAKNIHSTEEAASYIELYEEKDKAYTELQNKIKLDSASTLESSNNERIYHREAISEKDSQIEKLESEMNHLVAKNINSTEEATSYKELCEEKEKAYTELQNKIKLDSAYTLESSTNERIYHREAISERDSQIEKLESEINKLAAENIYLTEECKSSKELYEELEKSNSELINKKSLNYASTQTNSDDFQLENNRNNNMQNPEIYEAGDTNLPTEIIHKVPTTDKNPIRINNNNVISNVKDDILQKTEIKLGNKQVEFPAHAFKVTEIGSTKLRTSHDDLFAVGCNNQSDEFKSLPNFASNVRCDVNLNPDLPLPLECPKAYQIISKKITKLDFNGNELTVIILAHLPKMESHKGQHVICKLGKVNRVCYVGILRVLIKSKISTGRFSTKEPVIAGIEFSRAIGDSNGSYMGTNYFTCQRNCCTFCPLEEVYVHVNFLKK